MNDFFKKPLFVFEMANNHMGSVDHGRRIIRELSEASRGFDFNFGVKFQYRALDSFIHPDFKGRADIKYVKRFEETRLSEADFLVLKKEAEKSGFISICTPFDEASVDLIEKHNYDILKIGSCSFTDWPLLERIVKTEKTIIASTGGASASEMDSVVSFLEHRSKDFSLMHCVAEYPAQAAHLELNQIDFLKKRYPSVTIGYSGHELPDNLHAVALAAAKGALIFEKHVGVKTERYGMNEYTATPEQVRAWLTAAREAFSICGIVGDRPSASEKEKATLRALQRGVFAKTAIKKGDVVDSSNTFLAIPTQDGQVTANDMSKYSKFLAQDDIAANKPVLAKRTTKVDVREKVISIVKEANELLKNAGVRLPGKTEIEISHHYGIDKFHDFGCTIITVVNREYCKKLIIVLPGQKHPEQFHKKKEETFHILHGTVLLELDGVRKEYGAGEVVTVEKEVRHMFTSAAGAIIEEISSTHYVDDSYYTDPAISANKSRKTHLTYWIK